MGSSGVIYAIIVGAWAVYLVPMWLRREDELNQARQTQRYAAAIKVLANKEAFERRWGQAVGAEEAFPLAAGQNFAPNTRASNLTGRKSAASASVSVSVSKTAARADARTRKSAMNPVAHAPKTKMTIRTGSAHHKAGSAKTDPAAPRAVAAAASKQAVTATVAGSGSGAGTRGKATKTLTSQATAANRQSRTGLMARRRRVVGLLFTASTFGAIVTADLGAQYLWAMAIPAVLLSAYIARLRRDERIRAAALTRRRAAATETREVRDATHRPADFASRNATASTDARSRDAKGRGKADTDAAPNTAVDEEEADTESQRRSQVARRRSSAAARARAQAYGQETGHLRRASNS
jgi:hypothetical protein